MRGCLVGFLKAWIASLSFIFTKVLIASLSSDVSLVALREEEMG